MPPIWKYRGPADAAAGTFTDITDYFRLYDWEVTMNAEEGSVGSSQVTADDPDGSFDIVGMRQFRVEEDTATGSNAVIYAGYTAERVVKRGDYHRVGVSRVWDISLTDINTVLSRRVFDLNNANRPAETDVARVQWLLSVSEMALIDDSRYVNTSGAVAMDAVDYRGQTPADVLNDCSQQSGKDHFVWYTGDTDHFSLWYDFSSSENYTSPLRLSNVLSDIDSTWTFAISDDTELRRDPSRVYSGIYLPYDGGIVYQQDDATATTFARRDGVMPSYNVKSAAKAEARATRYLGDLDTEEDVITTTVVLPAAKVNFLMQGMRVQVKASHLPGYENFTYLRALRRTVQQLSEEFYAVTLDLSTGGEAVVDEPVVTEEAEAILEIGTANHTSDSAFHQEAWASTSVTVPPLQVGKEYRFVATVLDCLYIPLTCAPGVARGYEHIDGPSIQVVDGLASSNIVDAPGYGWNPAHGTDRPGIGSFTGISFAFSQAACGDSNYGIGTTFEGDWLEFTGPAISEPDFSISGTGISGFYGFHWVVRVRLESR